MSANNTKWKVFEYGVSSDPYFPVFSPNTGKCGPEKTPYLDTFHEVQINIDVNKRYKDLRPATLLKTDSNTGVFLWNLRTF